MNYIWETALYAYEHDQRFEDISLVATKVPNPYMEVIFDNINQTDLTGNEVEVNLLYRFSAMFAELVDINYPEYPELKKALVNIILHYLTILDLRQGLSRHEYYIKFIKEDVWTTQYGQRAKDDFGYFAKWQRRYVYNSMLKMYLTGPSLLGLKMLLKTLYPKSILYLSTDEKKRILVYIGQSETAALRGQLRFICDMFVPIEYIVHLFWEQHFGIIGIHETMIPDDLMMF